MIKYPRNASDTCIEAEQGAVNIKNQIKEDVCTARSLFEKYENRQIDKNTLRNRLLSDLNCPDVEKINNAINALHMFKDYTSFIRGLNILNKPYVQEEPKQIKAQSKDVHYQRIMSCKSQSTKIFGNEFRTEGKAQKVLQDAIEKFIEGKIDIEAFEMLLRQNGIDPSYPQIAKEIRYAPIGKDNAYNKLLLAILKYNATTDDAVKNANREQLISQKERKEKAMKMNSGMKNILTWDTSAKKNDEKDQCYFQEIKNKPFARECRDKQWKSSVFDFDLTESSPQFSKLDFNYQIKRSSYVRPTDVFTSVNSTNMKFSNISRYNPLRNSGNCSFASKTSDKSTFKRNCY